MYSFLSSRAVIACCKASAVSHLDSLSFTRSSSVVQSSSDSTNSFPEGHHHVICPSARSTDQLSRDWMGQSLLEETNLMRMPEPFHAYEPFLGNRSGRIRRAKCWPESKVTGETRGEEGSMINKVKDYLPCCNNLLCIMQFCICLVMRRPSSAVYRIRNGKRSEKVSKSLIRRNTRERISSKYEEESCSTSCCKSLYSQLRVKRFTLESRKPRLPSSPSSNQHNSKQRMKASVPRTRSTR